MKERPILFSAPMVRALLDGSKTQTRRILKVQPDEDGLSKVTDGPWVDTSGRQYVCPYGQPGDQLWVRETWGVGSRPDPWGGYDGIEYRADEAWLEDGDDFACHKVETPDDICLGDYSHGWKPSIHMPRWASRIQLEITDVRIERLQDISEEDAKAEGIEPELDGWIDYSNPSAQMCLNPIDSFRTLWEAINGNGSWAANPWVWVVEFRRV